MLPSGTVEHRLQCPTPLPVALAVAWAVEGTGYASGFKNRPPTMLRAPIALRPVSDFGRRNVMKPHWSLADRDSNQAQTLGSHSAASSFVRWICASTAQQARGCSVQDRAGCRPTHPAQNGRRHVETQEPRPYQRDFLVGWCGTAKPQDERPRTFAAVLDTDRDQILTWLRSGCGFVTRGNYETGDGFESPPVRFARSGESNHTDSFRRSWS